MTQDTSNIVQRTKTCTECGLVKPEDHAHFYPKSCGPIKGYWKGYVSKCKVCIDAKRTASMKAVKEAKAAARAAEQAYETQKALDALNRIREREANAAKAREDAKNRDN